MKFAIRHLKRYVLVELFVIFLISLIIPLIWFWGDYLIIGHDVGFSLNPKAWFQDAFLVLDTKANFTADYSLFSGNITVHALPALLHWLGFNIVNIEKLTFIFWFLALSLAMYYFIYSFYSGKKYRWLRLISSVFYVLNFFILTRFIVFERNGFSIMVAIPLLLALSSKYLDKKNTLLKTISLAGLVLFFFNGGGLPPFIGILIIFISAFLFYYFIITPNKGRVCKRIIILIIFLSFIFILVNTYWIGPFFYTNLEVYDAITENNFDAILAWLEGASTSSSISNLLKLQGQNEWHLSTPDHFSYFSQTKIGISLSAILSILIFLPLLFIKKIARKDKFFVLFFTFLALFFIFLSVGSYPPLGKYYTWLIKHVPFFCIFRSPVYKFSYGTVIAYAFLFGFSAQFIIHKIKSKNLVKRVFKRDIANFLGILLLILMIALNHLYFNPNIFKLTNEVNLRVKLPQEVLEIREYMKDKQEDQRTLVLPQIINSFGGVDYYNWGYWSLHPLPYLVFSSGVVYNREGADEFNVISKLYKSINIENFKDAISYAEEFNIKYFLLRKDFSYQWSSGSDDPEQIKKILNNNSYYFSSIKEFGQWELYELNINPQIINIYSDKEEVKINYEFERISGGTKYRIKVKDAKNSFDLILKTSFHPNWRVYFINDGKKIPLPEEDHFRYKTIFNAWKINPSQEDFEIIIEYWPQKLFIGGGIISLISVFLCFLILLLNAKQVKNKE